MQYYEQMFSLFRSTGKNAIVRWLVLLKVSGNVPGMYTCHIMSESFHYFEVHVKMEFSAGEYC
jgi:hypothetical protein